VLFCEFGNPVEVSTHAIDESFHPATGASLTVTNVCETLGSTNSVLSTSWKLWLEMFVAA
jgi:hypothetical protein